MASRRADPGLRQQWRERAPHGPVHWLLRQLFCRRGQHRTLLDWSPDNAAVACLDCPSVIRVTSSTNGWRPWPGH